MLNFLQDSPKLVESIVEHTLTGISIMRYSTSLKDFVFVNANSAFYDFNSFVEADVNGRSLLDVFPSSRENNMFSFLKQSLEKDGVSEKRLEYYHPVRGFIYQLLQAEAIGDSSLLVIFNDITDRENYKQRAAFEQQKFRDTINSLHTGIITTDPEGRVEIVNHYAQDMFNLSAHKVRGDLLTDLLTITPWEEKEQLEGLVGHLQINTIVCRDQTVRRAVVRKADLMDAASNKRGMVYAFEDVSEFVQAQEELLYINYHDIPTGFYNRTYLKLYLDRLSPQKNYGVIAADINGLKRINNMYGLEKGDQLIVLCANSIKDSVPLDSVCVRFGEDDFIAIVPPQKNGEPADLSGITKSIHKAYRLRQKPMGIDSSLSFGETAVAGEVRHIQQAIQYAQEQMLYHKLLERKSIHLAALNSLLAALQLRSHETEEHAQRLYDHAILLGKEVGISEKDHHLLSLLSSLHDIGKIGVPDFVLNKPGKLTEDEWKIMKGHPDLGSRILEVTPELKEIAPLVRAHHERWDGKGYPDGLAQNEIPLLSRIIAIVDAYDAMTNDRVYRAALTQEEALSEISEGAGTQFDPYLAPLFVEKMHEQDQH